MGLRNFPIWQRSGTDVDQGALSTWPPGDSKLGGHFFFAHLCGKIAYNFWPLNFKRSHLVSINVKEMPSTLFVFEPELPYGQEPL